MTKLTIIKVGGQVIDNPQRLSELLTAFAQVSHPKILVHGGGKKASAVCAAMGIEPQLVEGRRLTDAATLEVVTMVYAGLINKNIVAQLQALNCPSMGVSGADADLIRAHLRPIDKIDYGYAGDIDLINIKRLKELLALDTALVFCPITHNGEGQLLNTNADTIATELAVACSEDFNVELRYCFEHSGVLLNIEDSASVLQTLQKQRYQQLLTDGTVHSGMIPKLNNAFLAKDRGIRRVIVGNWQLATPGTEILAT
ncbi:MAG: acetylglutamate kinase [Saprospiraceae bacterium]